MPLRIRRFRREDLPHLTELFYQTVRTVNRRDYTLEQVQAWAPEEVRQAGDSARWQALAERFTLIAEIDGQIVGFCDLEADGHLDRFYVHAEFQGQGVGRALLAEVENIARRECMPRVFVEASITARPFFLKQGFVELAEQSVTVRGVQLANYRMQRDFCEPQCGSELARGGR